MGKRAKIPFFQTLNAFFFIFGGVVTKNAFSKMFPILKDDFFDTRLILSQHPHQVFCYFDNIFFQDIWQTITFFIFLGVYTPSIKIWEIICQTWPLQTPFSQHTHSDALVAFVWPEHIARKFSLAAGDKDTFRSF